MTSQKKSKFKEATVDGRNLANQLRLVVYPIIYRDLYIPGGAGFLPSTVSMEKIHDHPVLLVKMEDILFFYF